MLELRHATIDDAALIAQQRHSMFADNHFATEERLAEMDSASIPWLRERLADGRYVGLLLEQDGHAIAGAGIFFMDFPPHWMHLEPQRAYLLNFYTAPEARGKGYANRLLAAAVEVCRERGIALVTLHASAFGKPIYEKFGFSHSNEMTLRLDD